MGSEDISSEISSDISLHTFRQAVEHTGHAIYWTDTSGTIEYVNAAFEAQTGYTAEEAVGRNANLLQSGVHDDSFYEQLWETILDGDVWRGEIINERKDGERYVVKQTISPITDDTGTIVRFVAVNENITELRAYRDQLESERNRLASLLDGVPIPLVLVSFSETEPSVRQVNRAFETVFGLTEQQLLGSSLDEHIVTESESAQAREINERLRQDESVRREVTRKIADGEKRTFILEATPLVNDANDDTDEVLAAYLDITERKRAETKQKLLTEISQAIGQAETFDDGLAQTLRVICSSLDWTCGEVWQPVERRHAVETTEYLERVVHYFEDDCCDSLLTTSDSFTVPVGDGLPGRVYDSKSPVWISDVTVTSPNEFSRGELASADGIRTAVGVPLVAEDEVVAVLVFFSRAHRPLDETLLDELTDVTANLSGLVARKHAEELVKRRNERLEELASVISHDIRNPLNVAMSRLELVNDECDSAHLDAIETAHSRIQEIIEDMLTLARQGKAVDELESIELSELITRCWQVIETGTADLNIETTHTIRADDSRVRQLLANLLRNAVEHGPEGVTITVGDLSDGFYVADDGPGISVEDRSTVFEVGYTTNEDGTGFGLPIVKDIAQAHEWDVTITESEHGGARFEIRGVDIVDT